MDRFFSAVGIGTTAYISYRFLSHMYTFIHPSSLPHYLSTTTPTYALITGASDGIGKALAFELCARGFNVVIHGRNPDKLARVQRELQATHPTRDVRTLICDVVRTTPEDLEKLLASAGVADLHLTILINNVGGTGGMVSQPFQRLALLTPTEIDDLITANARFMTYLTRLLLPKFTSSPSPALIMNISSLAQHGMPYIPVYSGSKAYVATLTHALAAELAADGHAHVAVLNVIVGSVQSNQNHQPASLFVPTSAAMARAALARVGCGRDSVTAYWLHALQSAPLALLPGWVGDSMVAARLKPFADSGTKDY